MPFFPSGLEPEKNENMIKIIGMDLTSPIRRENGKTGEKRTGQEIALQKRHGNPVFGNPKTGPSCILNVITGWHENPEGSLSVVVTTMPVNRLSGHFLRMADGLPSATTTASATSDRLAASPFPDHPEEDGSHQGEQTHTDKDSRYHVMPPLCPTGSWKAAFLPAMNGTASSWPPEPERWRSPSRNRKCR